MGEYLLILYTLSPLTSPGTCPSSWSSGGGACCADFQVLALGGAALPLPGAGLSGGCLPREAAGGTAPVAGQLWKPGFSSGRNSVCRAWRLRGGAADLLSSGQERPCCPGPSRPLPVPGGGRILGCVPAPCAPEPALVDSRSRAAQPPPRSRRPSPSELLLEPRSPLRTEPLPLPEPLRAAPGAAQPPPRSRRPSPFSCSGSRRVPPCALQPLGSSAHSPGRAVALLLSQGTRGHPRPPGSCSNSLRAPFRPGRSVQLLLLRDGALLSWGHSPRPQPGSSRGPSPLEAFVSLFLFPRLPTLIEARTLLTVAFQLVSL